MKLPVRIAVSLLTGLAPWAVQAAAYKCTDSAGRVSFSDTPCPVSASKGEKVLGRGAGTNPLSNEEKKEFQKGVMMGCKAPRNVCECLGATLADTLTYEELMQSIKDRNRPSASILEKRDKAIKSCEATGAQQ